MKEAQGYVHAAQMMEFAQDAAKFPRPWELWEVRHDRWHNLIQNPVWDCAYAYRRHKHADLIGAWQLGAKIQMEYKGDWRTCDPDWSGDEYRIKPKTININGHEVPEPVRERLSVGQGFYMADPAVSDGWSRFVWNDDRSDEQWLSSGLIHLTEEAATLHAEALLSFTRAK